MIAGRDIPPNERSRGQRLTSLELSDVTRGTLPFATTGIGDAQRREHLGIARLRLALDDTNRFLRSSCGNQRPAENVSRQREMRSELEDPPFFRYGAVEAAAVVVHETQRLARFNMRRKQWRWIRCLEPCGSAYH